MTAEQLCREVLEYHEAMTAGPWGAHEGHVYSEPVIHGTETIIGDFAARAPEGMYSAQSVFDAHGASFYRTAAPRLVKMLKRAMELNEQALSLISRADVTIVGTEGWFLEEQSLRRALADLDAIANGETDAKEKA